MRRIAWLLRFTIPDFLRVDVPYYADEMAWGMRGGWAAQWRDWQQRKRHELLR